MVTSLTVSLCIPGLLNRLVKEFVASNDVKQIKKLTSVLTEEISLSHNCHARKGGLNGLAAKAIALGKVSKTGDYCTKQYNKLYFTVTY